MKNVTEVFPRLGSAGIAWLTIWRRKYGYTAEDICRKLREKIGEDVDPASVDA